MNHQSEISMLHNVIWNYEKESETLKLEVENLKLKEIFSDDTTIEKLLSAIKELHGKCIITTRSQILIQSLFKDLQKENTKLKEEVEQLKDISKSHATSEDPYPITAACFE